MLVASILALVGAGQAAPLLIAQVSGFVPSLFSPCTFSVFSMWDPHTLHAYNDDLIALSHYTYDVESSYLWISYKPIVTRSLPTWKSESLRK